MLYIYKKLLSRITQQTNSYTTRNNLTLTADIRTNTGVGVCVYAVGTLRVGGNDRKTTAGLFSPRGEDETCWSACQCDEGQAMGSMRSGAEHVFIVCVKTKEKIIDVTCCRTTSSDINDV